MRHFAEHGFAGASVPAIAADVGVTERTFYRHFATKEEVLFGDITTRLQWLTDALRTRPDGEELTASIGVLLADAPVDPQVMVEIARLRHALLSPARIERYYREVQGQMAAQVRAFLAERGAGPLAASVQAELVSGAVFAALGVWTEAGGADVAALRRLTAQALEQVRPAVLPVTVAVRPRRRRPRTPG